jgi:hypothetical protein
MPIDELRVNISNRRDRIFLLMEELRRLRIQQRLKVMRTSGSNTGSIALGSQHKQQLSNGI